MIPLSRLWTWLGSTFVPILFGWALYVRHAIDAPSNGETLSRAYFGLLVTIALGAALLWVWFFYLRATTRSRSPKVPMNTMFEDKAHRSALIGWSTATVFGIVVITGLTLFASSYAGSRIHGWDATTPLSDGFWSSRLDAMRRGCGSPPCWAIDRRIGEKGVPLKGVNEYLPYLTDWTLLAAALVLIAGGLSVFSASNRGRP